MAKEIFLNLSSGESVPVRIVTRRGVRNITLRPRIAPCREICVSKPWLVSDVVVLRFVETKRRWIENIFNSAPVKQRLMPGMRLVFLGRDVLLIHDATRRANEFICTEGGVYELIVGGGADMFERRVRDFVKAELLAEIKNVIKTVPRDFWPQRISLRDTTSRWGSCSSSGTISFSWRLAFAPIDVMRYVVMHELAHQKHMDHSAEFWTTVRQLYGFGVERAKRWLAKNGSSLHKYF